MLEVEIYSVSRRAQPLTDAPAAAYVLTADDIRRSGATTIPEALRLVPGVQVARIDANKWAITVRGFNGPFANKLLVLIDGRSVYTPMFSGVWWDVQDTPLEDISKIEVVRGPGSTLWGSNAVNGVINIITKPSSDTQGSLASVAVGGLAQPTASYRYGGTVGDSGHWRAYGLYRNHAPFEGLDGTEAGDAWDSGRAGFRVDLQTSAETSWSIQGEAYTGTIGVRSTVFEPRPPFAFEIDDETDVSGGNVMAVYRRTGQSSSLEFRSYYDRASRPQEIGEYTRSTADFELQGERSLGARNRLSWGLGYRLISDSTTETFSLSWDPRARTTDLFSAFAQDEIALLGRKLRLIFGAKIEHNDYTGAEIQPNVRFQWAPGEGHSMWGSISRAVRTPSRFDSDGRAVGAIVPANLIGLPQDEPVVIEARGSEGFMSEKLLAYELGYRLQMTGQASLDVAFAYNDYDDLRWGDPGVPGRRSTLLTLPWELNNRQVGHSVALELAADWQPIEHLRLRPSYGFLHFDLDPQSSPTKSIAPLFFAGEAQAPRHQALLWASLDPMPSVEVDLTLRFVDQLAAAGIDAYLTGDLRLGWHPNERVRVAVVGRNLIAGKHREFGPQLQGVNAFVPRTGLIKIDLWF